MPDGSRRPTPPEVGPISNRTVTRPAALTMRTAGRFWSLPRWMPWWLAILAFPVLALGVAAFTVLVRVQYLVDIPRYADEINEITPAFDIVRGTSFPLVS